MDFGGGLKEGRRHQFHMLSEKNMVTSAYSKESSGNTGKHLIRMWMLLAFHLVSSINLVTSIIYSKVKIQLE